MRLNGGPPEVFDRSLVRFRRTVLLLMLIANRAVQRRRRVFKLAAESRRYRRKRLGTPLRPGERAAQPCERVKLLT